MAFVEGYLTGLALILLIGPVLFVLLGTTLARGRAHGLAVVAGIFVGDVIAVLLCAYGVAGALRARWLQVYLALGGGLILLGLGMRYLLRPGAGAPVERDGANVAAGEPRHGLGVAAGEPPSGAATGLWGAFVQGFVVNFVNPFVFAVWLGIVGLAAARHGVGVDLAVFLGAAILGVVTLDVTKVLLAHRIRPWLRPRALRTLFRVAGLILLGFGLRLVWIGVA